MSGQWPQLQRMRGRTVVFQTAVTVACAATGFEATDLAPVEVRFGISPMKRSSAICAPNSPMTARAAPRAKAWASAWLDAIVSDDPTALVGLPLIRTCRMLRDAGLVLP